MVRPASRSGRRGTLLALLVAAFALVPGSAHAAAPPIVFGVYPGGGAGAVGPGGASRPESPELRRRALLALRAGRPFVLRLYDEYRRPSDGDVVPAWLAGQIAAYTSDGFRIELVLRYRPANPGGDVDGYVRFVRARVRQLRANPRVTHLQVTNEANVRAAPAAADGAYPRALHALVRGVIAAKAESRAGADSRLRVGFNWADQSGAAENAFFASLWAKGGDAFVAAVDWVGVDAYPGTWGPALPGGKLASAVRTATIRTMRRLRQRLLPRARLGAAPIHFSESGYPTGGGRSDAAQRIVMRATIRTVVRYRRRYGVTDLRWFGLRDADSSNPSFESQYGLMTDAYRPKPAFFTFRKLIGQLAETGRETALSARSSRSPAAWPGDWFLAFRQPPPGVTR